MWCQTVPPVALLLSGAAVSQPATTAAKKRALWRYRSATSIGFAGAGSCAERQRPQRGTEPGQRRRQSCSPRKGRATTMTAWGAAYELHLTVQGAKGESCDENLRAVFVSGCVSHLCALTRATIALRPGLAPGRSARDNADSPCVRQGATSGLTTGSDREPNGKCSGRVATFRAPAASTDSANRVAA